MKIIRLNSHSVFSAEPRNVTIGAFDGFHLGHQDLIHKVNSLAALHGGLRTLISFEPLPHEVFKLATLHQQDIPRIMPFRDKVLFLMETNLIDELIIIPFRNGFLKQSADAFIQNLLIARLGAKSIVVGDDFRFGFKALGDYQLLQQYADQGDFLLFKMPSRRHEQIRISSTLVRNALLNSDLAAVQRFLGREFTLSGKVIYGRQLARTLGFPTLNIALKHAMLPIRGVFNVRSRACQTGTVYNGIANIGLRPTVDGVRPMLEIHLFTPSQDFYGQYFEVSFLSKIRDEIKFSGIDTLKTQIALDVQASRAYFSTEL